MRKFKVNSYAKLVIKLLHQVRDDKWKLHHSQGFQTEIGKIEIKLKILRKCSQKIFQKVSNVDQRDPWELSSLDVTALRWMLASRGREIHSRHEPASAKVNLTWTDLILWSVNRLTFCALMTTIKLNTNKSLVSIFKPLILNTPSKENHFNPKGLLSENWCARLIVSAI